MTVSTGAIVIETHIVDWRRGIWCDRCNLSTAVDIDVALVHAESLRTVGTRTVTVCTHCDEDDVSCS